MQLLTEWITQIIVFLLMAAIIDLLIPASTMKRYINLIIGLILILIFLKPVFHILHIDVKSALESGYSKLATENKTDEEMENLIKMQKSDIQASQDAYIIEQLSKELTDIAKEPLEDKFDMEIQAIQFTFQDESNPSYEELEDIIVTLSESHQEKEVATKIEDIEINTKEPKHHHSESDDKLEDVQTLLVDVWEIENKKVTVLWEGKEP